jgi:hypothetical protein
LEEVAKVAFIGVVVGPPAVDVAVGSQILTSDAIRSSVGVNKAALKDDRLQVFIDVSNDAWLGFVYLVQL